MTVFWYVRKNFPKATSVQLETLSAFECDELVLEETNLSIDKELNCLINKLTEGDILYVSNLVTFGKRTIELQKLFKQIGLKKARLISVEEHLDTDKHYEIQTLLSIVEPVNNKIISEKSKQKLREIKESGGQLGRPSIDNDTVKMIQTLRETQGYSMRKIAKILGVSISSVWKYVN